MPTRISSIAAACVPILLALLFNAFAQAHEIGTTRVTVNFHGGGSYDVEIVTDAVALANKLLASSGAQPTAATRPDALQPLLAGFDRIFRQRVKIGFDASEIRPAITYSVTPANGPGSVP